MSNLADCIDLSEADEFIGYEFGPHMWHPNPLFSEPEYHAQILLEREIISLERCEALAKGLRFTNEELQHLKKIAAVDAMGENGTVWFCGTIDDGKYPCYFAVSRSGHSWDGFKENWEGFIYPEKTSLILGMALTIRPSFLKAEVVACLHPKALSL